MTSLIILKKKIKTCIYTVICNSINMLTVMLHSLENHQKQQENLND